MKGEEISSVKFSGTSAAEFYMDLQSKGTHANREREIHIFVSLRLMNLNTK